MLLGATRGVLAGSNARSPVRSDAHCSVRSKARSPVRSVLVTFVAMLFVPSEASGEKEMDSDSSLESLKESNCARRKHSNIQ